MDEIVKWLVNQGVAVAFALLLLYRGDKRLEQMVAILEKVHTKQCDILRELTDNGRRGKRATE